MPMPPIIRPARPDEYDEIARVWMNSWASTGLEDASNFLLAKLRARVPLEIEKGWSLFVADDDGTLAAMLALHLPKRYLDQLFVAPEYQGQNLGRQLLAFTRQQLPDEIWLRCVRENEKAWRWYEREGFVYRKGRGRADDRVRHEILSMEERGNCPMMKLYWSPRSRSFSALWLMEETGQPYERVLTDITTGAQKTPEYLAINPMGKVPALKDGDATLAEAAAICAYVAERYPRSQAGAAARRSRCAQNICTGCSSRRAASSPRWCSSRPRSR